MPYRQQESNKDILFICGLYKSGTSWLLEAFSRYSGAVGLREIDLVKSTHNTRPPHNLLSREDILKNIFGKNTWCKIPGDQLNQLHNNLQDKSAAEYYEAILRLGLGSKTRKPLKERQYLPSELQIPLSFFELPETQAIGLIRQFFGISSGRQVIEAFKTTHDNLIKNPYKLVFKGADQIAMLDVLKKIWPEGKKLVIIRDGRDAAISAFYYRKLQLKRKAPWAGHIKEPLQFLQDWKSRARKVLQAARKNELAVVRYEDLLENFERHFGKILSWLDWDYSLSEIKDIGIACSFEKQTGRKRGEGARDVKRKGIYGEWLDFFSDQEKTKAWNMAGELLEKFGYTKEGKINHDLSNKLIL